MVEEENGCLSLLGVTSAQLPGAALRLSVTLPIDLVVTGDYEEQKNAFQELLTSLALALTLVYMVLACQYESLRDPLIVMMSVPVAAVGVLTTLYLTGTTINVQS